MAPLSDGVAPDQPDRSALPDAAGRNQFVTYALPSPSVRQLRAAYLEPGQPNYVAVRSAFEKAHGKIAEEYYAQGIFAAAVMVHGKKGYKIRLDYDCGRAIPAVALALRELRLEEREKSALLQKKVQRIFAGKIYTIITHLCATWDSTTGGEHGADQTNSRLTEAVKAAKAELGRAKEYADDAARKSALAWYLWGLPFGGLIGGVIIGLIWAFPRIFAGQETINVSSQVGLSLAFGAVGAIVSVMVRITRGSTIDVKQQGRLITMVAGAFRPIIGAVFGAMFYILIAGGLLPLKPGEGVNVGLFYAGLAFLAGFSERWAQDTIVQSAPSLGNTGGEPPQQPPAAPQPARTPSGS